MEFNLWKKQIMTSINSKDVRLEGMMSTVLLCFFYSCSIFGVCSKGHSTTLKLKNSVRYSNCYKKAISFYS